MAGEKKKVNLVNLKNKFSFFLYNNYSCQQCLSIDKLSFGFTCEHKFCVNCNDKLTDQCKECKSEIENVLNDKLQNGLFPYFEDLKNVMAIDLNKVALKIRQSNENQQVKSSSTDEHKVTTKPQDVNTKDDSKIGDENKQLTDQQMNKDEAAKEEQAENEASNADQIDDKKQTSTSSRTSRRQTAKKVDESNKKIAEVKASPKNASKARETSRSKSKASLNDIFKAETEQVSAKNANEDHKQNELDQSTKTKSIKKTDKSSTKSSSKAQPSMVIISTSITDNELKMLNKFAKRFHAKIVNEYTSDITHLVTLETKPDSRLTTRTLKYLKSLLSHKWLLDFQWVRESLENDKLADEQNFELLGITKQSDENLGAPKRSRESNLTLFEGKQFYIDGKFGPKCGLPKSDYKELIKVGGGQVVESEKDIQDDTYIIIDVTSMSKSKYKGRTNSMSTTDFLNCVSDFKFSF